MSEARERLAAYLSSMGWKAPEESGVIGGLWRHRDTEFLMPVPHELEDDGLDWEVLTKRLAFIEDRSVSDVLTDIG